MPSGNGSMPTSDFRRQVLGSYGANATETVELLVYNENVFEHTQFESHLAFPLPPEPHISTWEEYAGEANQLGAFLTLRKRLVQLNFPIQRGISQTQAYQAVTRHGVSTDGMPEATGLVLNHPEKLDLLLHPTLAGVLPVLIAGDRQDFVSLVQALVKKNEPESVPDSMGSLMVGGFNNWDRVRRHLDAWQAAYPAEPREDEFKRLVPRKELYQDRFMILSRGPYSAVPAREMGLSEDEWASPSLTIRLEHESTHYFTRRVLGSMRNNLLDELIADYRGISAAVGCYRADWACRFMGVTSTGVFIPGGRLENYRGAPLLSDGAFKVLLALVRAAADHLQEFDQVHAAERQDPHAQALILVALTYLTVEELASEQAPAILRDTCDQVRRKNGH